MLSLDELEMADDHSSEQTARASGSTSSGETPPTDADLDLDMDMEMAWDLDLELDQLLRGKSTIAKETAIDKPATASAQNLDLERAFSVLKENYLALIDAHNTLLDKHESLARELANEKTMALENRCLVTHLAAEVQRLRCDKR